jgi:hypothetical protein
MNDDPESRKQDKETKMLTTGVVEQSMKAICTLTEFGVLTGVWRIFQSGGATPQSPRKEH